MDRDEIVNALKLGSIFGGAVFVSILALGFGLV